MSTFVLLLDMKRLIITHFLLNVYLLAMLQPALPILEYLINYDLIVNELCENRDKPILACNGKCYLGDQIEKQQNLNSDNSMPIPPKMDLEKLISVLTFSEEENSVIQENVHDNPIFISFIKEDVFVNFLLRPPQF